MAFLRPLVSTPCPRAAATAAAAAASSTMASATRPLALPFLLPAARPFSTTRPSHRQTPTHLKVPFDQVPDYPYGPFRWYKQRNSGLYGTAKIRFGNTVSQKRKVKSGTHWKPNRQMKRLWSPILNMFIRTRLTTQVLKTVDKLGGIDEYLLGTKQRRIKELGPAGWRLRWKLMQSPVIQERWARERKALGLPPRHPEPQSLDAPSSEEVAIMDSMLANEDEFVLGDEDRPGQKEAQGVEVARKAQGEAKAVHTEEPAPAANALAARAPAASQPPANQP